MNAMKFTGGTFILGLVAARFAAGAPIPTTLPATRPATVTVHVRDVPVRQALDQLAKQAGAVLPLSPPELFDQNPLPPVTLEIDRQPFWVALEEFGRKTHLEPLASPDDPYPRLVLGLGNGGFWAEPHAVGGPLVIFANEVERNHSVELRRRSPGEFERRITVGLTAFAEPGLRVLSASPGVKVTEAVDEAGRRLTPTAGDPEAPDFSPASNPGNGLYTWNLAVVLDAPAAGAKSIAKLAGVTYVRIQTGSERLEIDDVMRQRNVTRTVAGVPFTVKSLKKVDIEYLLQISLRREKAREVEWQNLHGSIYNGRMALYDAKGRLVAARANENGGDYGDRRIESTLRFVREPGISDPEAGEPYKLVWLAPTQSKDLPVPFELKDLPIPE